MSLALNNLRALKGKNEKLAGDFWGGLAAMLVALPSAIAFGVTIYSAIGPTYAGLGAIAGIVGTTAIGLIAPTFGGTNRLISTPCAPAAAVLSAVALELVQHGNAPGSVVLMLTVIGLLCGIVQVLLGTVKIGSLIRYIPYPVVSGYLTGVGLIIIGSQIPKILGAPSGTNWWHALIAPSAWKFQGLAVGVVTAAVMVLAPRFTRVVPASILGLLAGVLAYFGLSLMDPALLEMKGNALIIGPLGGTAGSIVDAISTRWQEIGQLRLNEIGALFGTAVTLAVLLSIDTLKTCVVLDTITRSRHDSNKELTAQGLGNIASACAGGMPGAGQMGATMVNFASGGRTKLSGVIEGVLALVAFLILGSFIAWIPVASLAGILIIVGFRMIDKHSFNLLSSPWTMLDFAVIAAVVVTALTFSLIAASGIGIALAMVLFIREQLSSTIIRRRTDGTQTFSRRHRPQADMVRLEKAGGQTAIIELQGSLFFGTKDQLYTALEPELAKRKYIVLDFRRVESVDVSAAHVLTQARDTLMERQAMLVLTNIPKPRADRRDIAAFFDQMELTTFTSHVKVFPETNDALEWVEDQILGVDSTKTEEESLLGLKDMKLFQGRGDDSLDSLETRLEKRTYKAGDVVFTAGDEGGELYLIRRGKVRATLPVAQGHDHVLTTFGQGDFFGGMAFLDHQARATGALAFTDVDLYVMRREQFEKFAEERKDLALLLMMSVARVLATRLRYIEKEMATLHA